jgi:hypothetical protein
LAATRVETFSLLVELAVNYTRLYTIFPRSDL